MLLLLATRRWQGDVEDGATVVVRGTAINGSPVADSNALRNIVAQTKPDTTARLTLVRDGRERSATATLDELPAAEVRR